MADGKKLERKERERGFSSLALACSLAPSNNLFPFFSLKKKKKGDTFNLIGCLLTGDQLQTMTYSAM